MNNQPENTWVNRMFCHRVSLRYLNKEPETEEHVGLSGCAKCTALKEKVARKMKRGDVGGVIAVYTGFTRLSANGWKAFLLYIWMPGLAVVTVTLVALAVIYY